MKLTDIQQQNITNYLINDGLEYQEFIEEMHDHFCDSIEAKMNEGISFFHALEATGKEFKCEKYSKGLCKIFPKRGIKALEKRYLKNKKNVLDKAIVENIPPSLFSWVTLAVFLYMTVVFYFTKDSSVQEVLIIQSWAIPLILLQAYIHRVQKIDTSNAGGIGWLLASKSERVRSIETDLFIYSFGNTGFAWVWAFGFILVHFTQKFDFLPLSADTYFYAKITLITLLILVQVNGVKLASKMKKITAVY